MLRQHETPLVGREIDLGILRGAFEKTVAGSTVQLVTIVGEPGVGKSRLVTELYSYIDALPELLVRMRTGRCLSYGDGITFWALGEIVKWEAGILESDDPAKAGRKLDALVSDEVADGPWLRQRLRPLVGLEAPEASREENFTGWLRYLELLAEDGPLVAVFEDLHWADEALLEFIEHVAEFADGVPLLLIGTARPELHARVSWGGRLRNLITINAGQRELPGAHTLALQSARGAVAEATGDFEAAVVEFERAAEEWTSFGMPYEAAQAFMGLGRCLNELGRSEASEALRTASAAFGELRATPARNEATALLAQALEQTS